MMQNTSLGNVSCVINQVQHYGNVWENGGKLPHIINLGNGWREEQRFFFIPVNSVQDTIRKAFKKLQLTAVCTLYVLSYILLVKSAIFQ
jgi:hypothetical protein